MYIYFSVNILVVYLSRSSAFGVKRVSGGPEHTPLVNLDGSGGAIPGKEEERTDIGKIQPAPFTQTITVVLSAIFPVIFAIIEIICSISWKPFVCTKS